MSHPHIKFTTLKEPRIGTNTRQPWSGREPHIGGETSVAALLTALKKWHSRPQAAKALAQAGSTAVPGLLNALYDTSVGVRVEACRILGKIPEMRSVAGLCGALWDEHELVRREAVAALGEIANPEAIHALLGALYDDDIWVRREAAHALGMIGHTHGDAIRETFPTLLSMVTESAEVRQASMHAFVNCGAAAIDFLIYSIDVASPLERNLAMQALLRIAWTDSTHVIERLERASSQVPAHNARLYIRLLNQIERQQSTH